MHQSWIDSNQRYHSASYCVGVMTSSPARVCCSAMLNMQQRNEMMRAYFNSLLRKRFTVYPPLRFDNRLNDVARFTDRKSTEKQVKKNCSTYAQIGICIGLSFVSMYKPASLSAFTTVTLA